MSHSLRALLLSALVSWNVSASNRQNAPLQSSSFGVPGANATFDYVIVGGGTAGLTIAARLAEDPSITVAVVEAGGFYEIDNGNLSVVPADATQFVGWDPEDFQPLVDWGFSTTPQPGAGNRKIHYARGKTLGGSSARNYMFYHRPTIETMQLWADEVGDQSYVFDKVLPFYEKSLTLTPQNPKLYHNMTMNQTNAGFGKQGPLQASYQNYISPFLTYAQPAFESIGQRQIDGFNTGELIGSGFATWTIDASNATRSSSETSFLRQALRTTTLQVYTQTMAQKILFDSNKTATGVVVTTAGTFGTPSVSYTLSARKEVILSAGAFQSPQLLMVSGIGPQETLETYDIPIIKVSEGVGQNLWDQTSFAIGREVNMLTVSAALTFPEIFFEANAAYIENATGPFSVFGAGYFGFEKLPAAKRAAELSASTIEALKFFPSDWPEIEFLPINAYLGTNKNYATADPLDGKNYASVAAGILAPLSRGNVTISSSSMNVPPVINPNFLTHPADKELAIAAFKRLRDAWSALETLNVTIGAEKIPGPSIQTDAEILEYISSTMIMLFHPVATCKMGRKNDSMAVVDTAGRVYGVQSLRVVDASIFPFGPPGHPQSSVYMVAEKIADAILKG